MSNVVFKLNKDGVKELLRSEQMKSVCQEYANSIAGSLGEGYEVNTYIGTNRANASIGAVSDSAIKDNSENDTLIKAVSR